jgi:hypothetical protein
LIPHTGAYDKRRGGFIVYTAVNKKIDILDAGIIIDT